MEFSEVMVNMCIGIVGGIFLSIIVSRVFLAQSVHSEQLVRVQEHFEKSYKLLGLFGFYPIFLEKDDLTKSQERMDSRNKALLNETLYFADMECESFMAMRFDDLDGELHTIAVDLNDYMHKLRIMKSLNSDTIVSLCNELEKIHGRFNSYKKNNNKILKMKIVKDKVLRVLFILLLLIIALTLIV